MKSFAKRLLTAAGLVIALYAIVNWGYIYANLKYFLHKPTPQTQSEANAPVPTMDPNNVVIESLNIRAPLIYIDEASEKVFQKALQTGVVHYPNTALPGEAGNAYFFGHSSDFIRSPYQTVFALLPKIQKDAIILISNKQGIAFRYKVIETKVVSPNDVSVLDQHNNEKHLLSLQTSYPIGTALKRFVVIAELQP